MLLESLFIHAASQPQDLAIIDDQGSYTYQQLTARTSELAQYFAAHIRKPRLGLAMPSGAGFVASFHGAMLAGKVIVPINFLLGDREIAHCIHDADIDTVVTVPQLAARFTGIPQIINLENLPAAGVPTTTTTKLPSPPPDEVAVIMYTSGTSGLPKGVLLTHANLQSNVDAAIAHINLQNRHRFLGILPLFHAFGMTGLMLAPIQLGATIVYMARFNPVAAMHAIKTQGISLIMGVPSMFAAILRLKDAAVDDFKSVYAVISGGEPLSAALRQAFHARFGITIYEAYGMTETSLAISLNTPQSSKPGSVGKPVPGMDVKIADDDEILLKGPMVTKGYHNLPAETAAAFTSDGYFRTGDLGRLDGDRFLYITGRKKELIIIAGEKAAPREIEETLMRHPAVAEAAVIGKKDPVRGEVAAAFVIVRDAQSVQVDELREFCREQGLAQWKIPREIQIVTDLPRSPTGKVLKRMLAQPTSN